MEKGSISKIIRDRHFGFIHLDDSDPGAQDVFFHGSACSDFRSLQEGDHLEFEIEQTDRGMLAKNVKKIS